MSLLLYSNYDVGEEWQQRWPEIGADTNLCVWPEHGSKDEVEMIAIDTVPPEGLLESFPNLKAVQFLGHGVNDVLDRINLTRGIKVARLADPGIIEGMNEYVLHQILEYRWHMETYRQQQKSADWSSHNVPIAADVHIGILGLGSIGTRITKQLVSLGYQVSGWSRSEHNIDGVDCHSGDNSLDPLLGKLDIVVGVLPETSTTRGLANASRFQAMKSGAYFINVGRGSLVDEAALIEALDSGHLSGATLDVFSTEPLSADHPLWRHPKITMSPHIAGGRPTTAIEATVENYRRVKLGEALLNPAMT
jgi:glyoxylate/hydroxypyruvate reductase